MVFDWMFCLIPVMGLWTLAYYSYLDSKSWMSPPTLFCGFWAFLAALHLILAPDVRVWAPILYWIFAMLFFVYFGQRMRGQNDARRGDTSQKSQQGHFPVQFIEKIIILAFISGLFGFAILVLKSPEGIRSLRSVQAFAEMAQNYTTQRYRGHSEPVLFRATMVLHYLGCFFAGNLLASPIRRRSILFGCLPLCIGILVTVSLTTKAALLFTLLLMMSSYLAARVSVVGTRKWKFTAKDRAYLMGGAATIFLLFIGVQMVRYEYSSLVDSLQVVNRLRLDFIGFLGPISVWAKTYFYDPMIPELSFGSMTFSGPASLLFPIERKTGIFSDAVVIGFGQHTSNIYTVFRSLILDFGLMGTFVFSFVVGYAGQSIFSKVSRGGREYHPLLAAFILNILWSHITMAFNYNSIVFAWLAYAVLTFSYERYQNFWSKHQREV